MAVDVGGFHADGSHDPRHAASRDRAHSLGVTITTPTSVGNLDRLLSETPNASGPHICGAHSETKSGLLDSVEETEEETSGTPVVAGNVQGTGLPIGGQGLVKFPIAKVCRHLCGRTSPRVTLWSKGVVGRAGPLEELLNSGVSRRPRRWRGVGCLAALSGTSDGGLQRPGSTMRRLTRQPDGSSSGKAPVRWSPGTRSSAAVTSSSPTSGGCHPSFRIRVRNSSGTITP